MGRALRSSRAEICPPGPPPRAPPRGSHLPNSRPKDPPTAGRGFSDSPRGPAPGTAPEAPPLRLPTSPDPPFPNLTYPLPECPPSRWPSRPRRERSGARRAAGRPAVRRGPAGLARPGAAGPGLRPVPRGCSCPARGWRPPRGRARRPGARPGSARPAVRTTRSQAPRSRFCAEVQAGGD